MNFLKDLKMDAIWMLAKMMYKVAIRPILFKAVDDPGASWDDWLMNLCDKIFDCEPE